MLQRIYDWLWKRLNRKPPRPRDAYMAFVMPWVAFGALIGLLAMFISSLFNVAWSWQGVVVVAFILLLFFSLLMFGSVSQIRDDKRKGYYDIIAKHAAERWAERARNLGMNIPEE